MFQSSQHIINIIQNYILESNGRLFYLIFGSNNLASELRRIVERQDHANPSDCRSQSTCCDRGLSMVKSPPKFKYLTARGRGWWSKCQNWTPEQLRAGSLLMFRSFFYIPSWPWIWTLNATANHYSTIIRCYYLLVHRQEWQCLRVKTWPWMDCL
jgi:hypothetical protein